MKKERCWQRTIREAARIGISIRGFCRRSREACGVVRDHRWVGSGLGTFAVALPKCQSFPTDLLWDHAHNDCVEALTETGGVGGMLTPAALILFFRLAFQGLAERLTNAAGCIQLGAALGCCGLLVHSFADFNLHIPANAAWLAVCSGLAVGIQVRGDDAI